MDPICPYSAKSRDDFMAQGKEETEDTLIHKVTLSTDSKKSEKIASFSLNLLSFRNPQTTFPASQALHSSKEYNTDLIRAPSGSSQICQLPRCWGHFNFQQRQRTSSLFYLYWVRDFQKRLPRWWLLCQRTDCMCWCLVELCQHCSELENQGQGLPWSLDRLKMN